MEGERERERGGLQVGGKLWGGEAIVIHKLYFGNLYSLNKSFSKKPSCIIISWDVINHDYDINHNPCEVSQSIVTS